jgi:mannose-6-phosphate isomerase-like protein (cupin superfamily)
MDIREPTVTYVPPGEGEALWFVGQLITYKVRGDGEDVTIFELTVGPYGGAPAHKHRTQDETHYILEGQFTFVCGDRTINANPGSVVHVPRSVCHAFTNLGPKPGRILFIATHPGPLERFYDEAGEPATDRSAPPAHPVDMEKILAIARRTGGLELVPPGEK